MSTSSACGMNKSQIAARRKGGMARLKKYGLAHLQATGKLGGRPKLKTLDEITESRAQQTKNKERRCSNEAVLKRALELTAGRAG